MTSLFTPLQLRGLTLKNRTMVSPMCQYSARHGLANDWHLVHLGRFAQGGFGLVMVEATAVTSEGRISYGDLGLWQDAQTAPLRRIAAFLKDNGAAAAIQLAHAGRKGASPIAWRGSFNETEDEKLAVAFEDWTPVAPSAERHGEGHKLPLALDRAGMDRIREGFVAAAQRALAAGFDIIEIHSAHGYLLHEFLSPVANHRGDRYGGRLQNRMRFPLEVAEAVRKTWPADRPLFVRISATDWLDGGWTLDDSIVYARELKSIGVDLIDCSSGGLADAKPQVGPLYQVPFAQSVRREADIPTAAVGLISHASEADNIIESGKADLVALARGALADPNWPAHARRELGGSGDPYDHWPVQARDRVRDMDRALRPHQTRGSA